MHRILILGASGFIGNSLYKELQGYYDVYGTYHSQAGMFEDNQVFFAYDHSKDELAHLLMELAPTLIISSLSGNFESQLKAHQMVSEYALATQARIIFLSSVMVFDSKGAFPAYEKESPSADSQYGRFKISVEKLLLKLPKEQVAILRLPMILGVNSPMVSQLKEAIKHQATFDVHPNLIVNVNTNDKVAQQVHYIINKSLFGTFHLGSSDVIHHSDLFQEISEKISDKKPIFKNVYSSNEDRYLAALPKHNKLPKNYRITVPEVITASTLNEEIITLKSGL